MRDGTAGRGRGPRERKMGITVFLWSIRLIAEQHEGLGLVLVGLVEVSYIENCRGNLFGRKSRLNFRLHRVWEK